MTASTLQGRLLWYELMTTDTAAAEAFYQPVVGWTTTPFGDAGVPYSMWTRPDGTPMGGVMALPDEVKAHGVPPHWMMYVGVGRMQTVKDPHGAAFSIYQPTSPPQQPEAAPELGDVSWLELYTTDSEAAMAFYTDLFGWQATETMDMGEMGQYRMFGRAPGPLGGMMTKTPDMAHLPNAWLIYFRVPDVHAAAERVKAHGGQVLHGPMEVPGGDWIVQCLDPQGAAFALDAKKV